MAIKRPVKSEYIHFRIQGKEKKAFDRKCNSLGLIPAQVLRELMAKFVNQE